jgi:hypothetical protein
MTSDELAATYWVETCTNLRAEIELLRKMLKTLEDSRDTWKALSEAWQWLAENKA